MIIADSPGISTNVVDTPVAVRKLSVEALFNVNGAAEGRHATQYTEASRRRCCPAE
jgi:hypothetical protein